MRVANMRTANVIAIIVCDDRLAFVHCVDRRTIGLIDVGSSQHPIVHECQTGRQNQS